MDDKKVLRPVPKYILEITVFLCGAIVMIYEVNGSRIVAPFIGASTHIWTSLIGVILGALSLGYWFGGKLADKKPQLSILATAIFFAGGLVSVTILIKDIVLSAISAMPLGIEIKALSAALFLFAPASVALGFVIPYATKLRIDSLDDSGKTVGRLYALSTLGSIVGTFAAGFVLIPFVGSVRTLYLVAGSLLLLAILLGGISFTRLSLSVVIFFVLGIAGSEFSIYQMRNSMGMHDFDTQYSRVMVFDTKDPRTGLSMKTIATDPRSVQSAQYHNDDRLALEYTRFYDLIKFYDPSFNNTLMIGGAGYSYPRSFIKEFPDAKMDVVEIDPQMTDIARNYFGLEEKERLKIYHEDGRVFLNNAADSTYDAVMMDAFGSLFSVPYQLSTIEAIRHIDRILKDDGVVIFNLGSAVTGPSSYFLQAEFAAYRSVFPLVHLYKVRPSTPDDNLQNLIMIASKNPDIKLPVDPPFTTDLDFSEDQTISYDPLKLLEHRYLAEFPVTIPIPTDDLAPIERYASIAQRYQNSK